MVESMVQNLVFVQAEKADSGVMTHTDHIHKWLMYKSESKFDYFQ